MLVTGIGHLVTNDPSLGPGPLGVLRDAAAVIDGERIAWVGPRARTPEQPDGARLDVGGRCVIPGFVDAHTHLVFAGDRSAEFAARMAGEPYRAGGIRTTVAATRAASPVQLRERTRFLAREALTSGTTTLEVKSGYGLSVEAERRQLEVVATLTRAVDLPELVPTFLGAHVVPAEHDEAPQRYVDLVTGPMLDACAPLARWCDVFCEEGAFDASSARRVLSAGAERGLGLRVHANQLRPGPGAQIAAELGAASADHCTHLTDADVDALHEAGVVATLLPTAELGTRSAPPSARRLLDAGVTVALATDCNPGTSYTTSMPLQVALGVAQLGMAPDEALWAATAGGAASLRRTDVGRLSPGARADLVVLATGDHIGLAYRPGVDLVDAVIAAGRLQHRRPRDGARGLQSP